MIILIIVIFVVISGLVIWKILKSNNDKVDAIFRAAVPMLATLLGVFLALSINAGQQKENTINNLKNVITVAISEAEKSLEIIEKSPKRKNELEHKDKERLVLESPAKALDVLVSMPSFLEYGSTDIVQELLKFNTSLKWSAPNRKGGGIRMSQEQIVTANRDYVLSALERVIELLEIQLEKL